MHPSINNLAFTTTTTTTNNNNNHNPNRDSSSYHPINSPCIFYEDNTFLQLLHDMPHKHDTPIVAHYQSFPNMKIHSTNTNFHIQTPTGVLIKGYSPENDFHYHNLKKIARDRSSKKDRHRKINTVQGPRYPRMRLSRDVAKNFFGLQDMLGFDKASKTVEWLLTKSDTAIKQLITNSTRAHNVSITNTNGASSTSISSECEVLSGIIEDSPLSIPREVTMVEKAKQEAGREKKTAINRARAFGYLAKETRERARARARERTVEKKIKLGNGNYYIKNVPYADIIDQNNDQHSRSWSTCPQS